MHVSPTQQGRQREPCVKTLCLPRPRILQARRVLNAALYLDTRAKKLKYKFKKMISLNRDRTHKQLRLQSHTYAPAPRLALIKINKVKITLISF